MESPPPDGVAQLDAEERAEREQELRAMLWDVRMGDDSASDGYEAGPGTSWALSEAAAVPGTPAPVGISPHSNPAMAVNESREQLLHPFPHRPAAAAASSTPEISPGSYASSSKAGVVLEPLPAASLTPGLGPSGHGKQSYAEIEKEQSVEVKGAQADLVSSSLLVALRGSCEPAELVSIMSQMAVTLRASEMERRHLKLQCCALRNEQARLNAQVQSLARRDRELEEHVLLLQAQLGDNAVSSPGTLPLLRGQMLEAARAEAERAKQDAEAAAAERERVEVEKEAEVRQAHQQLEALREEMGRLAGQVAQSAVLSSAQEREWRERQRRQEQELKHMDSLSRDVERLSKELDEARAARALEEQQHGATQRRLAEEEQATLSLNKKVEALEAEVAGAQARLREAQAEVVVLQRTLKAGEDEESGRLAGEMERMTQRFYEERRALEQRVEQLTAQLEARAGAVQEEEEEPSSGCNMMRQFIEDGSEDGGDVESGVVHRYHREPAVERLLSPDGKSAVEAEVWRRVEAERSKMAEAFQEELRAVLAGARRAFEQERHSEMAELERQLEAERSRRERTRVLELEALRHRMEDERQMAVRAEADRLADELQARVLEARRCAEEEVVGLLGRVEECLAQEPMGVAEGAGEGAVAKALASLLTKLAEWREAVRQQAAAERVQGSEEGKGEAVHVGVQTERQEGLEQSQGCQTDETGVEELADADEARWRELEAGMEAAAAEAVRALRQEMEGLRQAEEAEVARLSEELARLRSEAGSAEDRWRAEAARHAAEAARLQDGAEAARQAYEARISEVAEALRASKERCVALEESAAEASSVEEQVRALQARMDVEIERATKGHDEVVVRLEAQLQQARAEAAEAMGRAEEAERERRDVLGSAEREWRAKLEDIHAKMKLLQSALVKMGRRAASKDETVKQLRGELEEARRAEEVRRQVERERAEGLVREADDKDGRVKELDKALHRARKEVVALQRQAEEQRMASDRDVEARLRREVEQLERRLSTRHEKELREALERARRESGQEMELVMTTMRRRYQRKLQKLQAQFEQDKEDLVLAAIVEARRTPRANKEKRDHHRGGRGQLTPPTPQVCLRTNFFDY